MERYGDPIRGSVLCRAFCLRCGEPMRVEYQRLWDDHGRRIPHYCRDCGNRDHVGCSSPPSPNDDDGWKASVQDAYGDCPGL